MPPKHRYQPYEPGTPLEQVLTAITVSTGGDRAIIYRFDEQRKVFVKSVAEQVAINTSHLNENYKTEYPFDEDSGDIVGLCNFFGQTDDPDKNVATREGQALYIPVMNEIGEKLLIVVEREYKTEAGGKLYRVEEYARPGEARTEVKTREFHRAQIETAMFIADTWETFLFKEEGTPRGLEFKTFMQETSNCLTTVQQYVTSMLGYFGSEMRVHSENVGRMSKLALRSVMKLPAARREQFAKLLPCVLTRNSDDRGDHIDMVYNMHKGHDSGKNNNPQEETEWDGKKKAHGQSVRSRQHELFTEIQWTLPFLPPYARDVANHHTVHGHYAEATMLSMIGELADSFDAIAGLRRRELKHRSQTAVEAIAILCERLIAFDSVAYEKYRPGEMPDVSPYKEKVKIPANAVALMAKALELYLEKDIFINYARSRTHHFRLSFKDWEGRTVQDARVETNGVMYSPKHGLEHLRPNGEYSNNISNFARVAGIITGQAQYDADLPPGLQDETSPDTYKQIKAKTLAWLREKILSRDDIKADLAAAAAKIQETERAPGRLRSVPAFSN